LDDSLAFFDANDAYKLVDLSELFSITGTCLDSYTITLLDAGDTWAGKSGTAILAPSKALDLSVNQIEISWSLINSGLNTAP